MTREPVQVRHITVDCFANIYEVTNMFDRFANETADPALAVSCVIQLPNGFQSVTTDDVPIYTVH
jgi:hypothetical protein